MTEAEWWASTDSAPLVEHLGEPYPERKARLLMLAFCLLRKRCFAHAVVREAVKALDEHYSDPLAPDRPFEGRKYRAVWTRVDRYTDRTPTPRDYWPALGVFTAVEPDSIAAERGLAPFGVTHCLENTSVGVRGKLLPRVRAAQARLVRDIFGNPFSPVTFSPSWRTSTAVGLARGMYVSRDLTAMPILADALQDAGCDDADVLGHCRGVGPHVRGCWVLDLLFGQE